MKKGLVVLLFHGNYIATVVSKMVFLGRAEREVHSWPFHGFLENRFLSRGMLALFLFSRKRQLTFI